MTKAILRPFEVSEREIMQLQERQLVDLVRLLLNAEAQAAGIPQSAVQASLRIHVPDGGEDGRVEWDGGPDRTDYIPRRFTAFQMKAEALTKTKLRAEPIESKGRTAAVKVAVRNAIACGGAYVVVTSKTNVTTPTRSAKGRGRPAQRPKLDELREELRDAIAKHTPQADKAKLAAFAVDIYGPEKIRAWVNRHPMVALWVRQQLALASADFPFKTLDEWSMYEDHKHSDFVPTPEVLHKMTAIQDALLVPRAVVRLVGFSGLGKSRLVFEALRAPLASGSADLAPIVAYARRASPAVEQSIDDLVRGKVRALVVVDDCASEDHRRLRDLVRRADSQLSLITMDYDFGEGAPGDHSIVLDRAPDEVVKSILLQAGTLINTDDLDRATDFCSGFPEVAVLVIEALREGARYFADFKDRNRVAERLVWGRGPADAHGAQALCSLAVFRAVGCDPPQAEQFEWVAKHLLGISVDEFEARLKRFENRTIVQRRGYSLSVEPRPLAASLAAWFWRDATAAQRNALLSGTMPDQLKEAMCQRLADLNYLKDARDVAAQLCGPKGPFGKAEALNTEFGARCLREIAEVAPEEAIAALERAFGDWSAKRIKAELVGGRRQIVWTLEALAWVPSVFERVMRLLLRLAAGENESWGNNASAEFAQRFRISLPATSVSLKDRLLCLETFADSISSEEVRVLVKGLGASLDDNGASWVSGSQAHGTMKAHEHYRPKLWQEIFDYVRGVMSLLRALAAKFPESRSACGAAIASASPRLLLHESVIDQYEETLRALAPEGLVWGEVLEKLSWTIKNELSPPNLADVRQRVRNLYDSLLPSTLRDRALFYVKNPPYHLLDLDAGDEDALDRPSVRASELGKEFASHWDEFVELLPALSSGESREAYAFGKAFVLNRDDPSVIATIAKKALVATRSGDRNASLLGGILAALWEKDRGYAQRFVFELAKERELIRFLPFFCTINLTEESMNLLSELVASRALAPKTLHILGMGRVLDQMSDHAIKTLVQALISVGPDAVWVALDLLAMSTHQRPERHKALADTIESALTSEGLLESTPVEPMAEFHFETLANSTLVDASRGARMAEALASALVRAVAGPKFKKTGRLLEKLAALLVRTHPKRALAAFSAAIEAADVLQRFHLRTILASPFSFTGKKEGAIFLLPTEAILEACRGGGKKFVNFIAEVAPLFEVSGGEKCWTTLARALIDEFGDQKTVLDALAANIGTGGWSGPASSYLRTFVRPLQEMTKHRRKEVRTWARAMLVNIARQIAAEDKEEAERNLRAS